MNNNNDIWDSHGFMPEEMKNDFTVYELGKYLETENLVIYERPCC